MKKNIIIFFFLSSFCLYSTDLDSVRARVDFNSNKFKYILETIYNNYADSVDIDKISEQAFNQMLNSLDRHSFYLTKDKLFQKNITDDGHDIGIGVNIRFYFDTVFVYSVQDGSPAQKAGIKPFDRIVAIDNKFVFDLKPEEVIMMLKGDFNSNLVLEIISITDAKKKKFNITRTNVTVSSINSSIMIPGSEVGYVNFKKFTKISHDEFETELKRLNKLGMKSLIIDLRDNPGGFLEQVGDIINEFLTGKEIITYTQSRNPQFRYLITSNDSGNYKNLPLILLVNENSASACELFAAAVQELDRGLVVGRRTFGKSSAQLLWTMNDSTGFQMTVAEYLSPLGRKICKPNGQILDESMKLSLNEDVMNKLNEMINIFGAGSKLPVYTTKKGRSIVGGSSIFPDFYMENDTITLLTEVLNNRNTIIEYVFSFVSNNFNELNKEYGKSLAKYSRDFIVDDLMLSDLKRHSYSKNIWNEEMFQNDKMKIKIIVKAEIARAFFGDLGYYSILIKNDKFVVRAVELMPEAENLLTK